jgi:hypothetical protein
LGIFSGDALTDLLANEARHALSQLLPTLPLLSLEHQCVLEVGAGSCILSAYLANKGLDVTALEPLGHEVDRLTNV